MQNRNSLNFVVLLLLVGIYFILKYFSEKQLTDLIYGIILVIYHVRLKFIYKSASK